MADLVPREARTFVVDRICGARAVGVFDTPEGRSTSLFCLPSSCFPNVHLFPRLVPHSFSSPPFSLPSLSAMPAYGLADVDGKKQATFAPSAAGDDSTTARGSPTNIKSKNQLVDEYNPALRTPSGVHPLLVDELLPADNYAKGNDGQIHYWADLPAGGELAPEFLFLCMINELTLLSDHVTERMKFAIKQANAESAREFKHVGRMFKKVSSSPLLAPLGLTRQDLLVRRSLTAPLSSLFSGSSVASQGILLSLRDWWLRTLHRGVDALLDRKPVPAVRVRLASVLGDPQDVRRPVGALDRVPRDCGYHCRSGARRNRGRLGRKEVWSRSGCAHQSVSLNTAPTSSKHVAD
jgi:hypothetical protein